MKKTIIIIFVLILSAFSSFAVAQQQQQFKISILATRNFSDLDFLQKNLNKSDLVSNVVISLASPGLTELKGTYRSSSKYLIEEITALAQHRFQVEITNTDPKNLLITLKKITAIESSALAE
ncbi:MAG: hypothetical protein ABH859_05110 [Pseudomonadota bacterium]